MVLVVKNLPANAGDARDSGLIPGSGRYLGIGNGNTLHYCHWNNPMERGDWRATVRGVAKGSDMPEQLTLSDFEFIKTIQQKIVNYKLNSKIFCLKNFYYSNGIIT